MTKHAVMGSRAAIAAAAAALLLAACGGSSNPQSSAVVPSTASTATAPTTTTTQTAATPTTPASTTATAPAPCVTADFSARFLGQAGATGHGELGFALRNITSHQCRTYGYPGVLFLGKTGQPLPTTPTHTTVDFFGNTTKTELVVLPGASVSFRLGVNHGAGSTTGCTTAYGLQIIAPDDTHTTRVTIPQGAAECGGQVTVSPLQASTLAFSH
ncbi:MAG TPA: DUF4232 domain-containing protein [Solirubrobacteraceae bacterium]|jgi:hypothetical protein|nr:DUF4232 domain-containing protein [Solirubrobacteraceae bacterium]